MVRLGRNALDDASLFTAPQGPNGPVTLHAPLIVEGSIDATGTISGTGEVLANNTFLQSRNAANTADLNLVKADATDNSVINAATGKKESFTINNVEIAKVDANGLTSTAFLLTDGSDKNFNIQAYAAGTAYQLTATSAALTFGTTQPAITINKAGTYLLWGRVSLQYNAATFAASRAVTLKLRRTNNTAADIANSSSPLATDIITTKTYTFGVFVLPPVIYTTTNVNDILTIFGDVAVVPTAGSLDAIAATIIAIRLH